MKELVKENGRDYWSWVDWKIEDFQERIDDYKLKTGRYPTANESKFWRAINNVLYRNFSSSIAELAKGLYPDDRIWTDGSAQVLILQFIKDNNRLPFGRDWKFGHLASIKRWLTTSKRERVDRFISRILVQFILENHE